MNRRERRAASKQSNTSNGKAHTAVTNETAGVAELLAEALPHHQAGRLAEAERLYRQILAIDPNSADGHHLLGVIAHQVGAHDTAVTLIGQAIAINGKIPAFHTNLGVSLYALGKVDAALACYRQALALDPSDARTYSNMGNAFHVLGRLDDAVDCYRHCLDLKPDNIEAYNNLGVVLQDQGRVDEAVVNYQRALVLHPAYANAHYNLGNAFKARGESHEAIASYRRALDLKPDYAEAYNNLGVALQDVGRVDEAIVSYRRSLDHKPGYADAYYNLANALQMRGELDEAAACFRQVLAVKPDNIGSLNGLTSCFLAQGEAMKGLECAVRSLGIEQSTYAQRLFVECVARCQFREIDDTIYAYLVRAISEPWAVPRKLTAVSANLIKLNPSVSACLVRAVTSWPQRLSAQELFGSAGVGAFAADPLLCALLGSAPIDDIALERLLTLTRHALLEIATETTPSNPEYREALDFHSAMARQCFINEYVYPHTDAEIQKATSLRDTVVAALDAGTEIPAPWLTAVATYFPLHTLPNAARLLDRAWPESVATLLVQQVGEPAEELALRATIPRLTPIEDDVSLVVQNQYEENPYPRWIAMAPNDYAETIDVALCRKFPLVEIQTIAEGRSTEILIAGCGTGQHAIDTAQRFEDAQVLAVDLSMASLSYAKRKTRELGLNSIEFAQADLLELGTLGRSFDVIESVGVLHHLADPQAGWRVLLSMLRPQGVMKLGFYSEVARRDIVRAREFIATGGYGMTATEIRKCRQHLLDLDNSENLGTTTKSSDFFTVSTCRDLLFHVQEHRVTLSWIASFLQEQNLAFLGFIIEPPILRAYQRRFPNDRAATDLSLWQVFENEHPDIFFSMYQFWVQRKPL